jgi:hypothetical protein
MNKRLLLVMLALAGNAHAFREEDSPEDVPPSAVAADNKPAKVKEPEPRPPKEPEHKVVENLTAPAPDKPVKDNSTPKENKAVKDKASKPAADTKTDKTKTTDVKTVKAKTAESTTAKIKDNKPASAESKPVVPAKPVVKTAAPAAPESAASATVTPASPPAAAPVASEPTLAQRQQESLLANAEKIDNLNRELLTHNESLQLDNEKLAQQVELLKHDRSGEEMRNGALAVIIGLFLGWFLSGNKRKHDKW